MARRFRADPEYLSDEAFNALLAKDGQEAPQRAPANPNAPARQDRDVVRRPDGSSYTVVNRSYTNETPTQLLNRGLELDPETGVWVETLPGSINTEDYGFRVLTDQELEARRVAEEQGVAKQAALESVRQASDQALFGGSNQGAYLRGAVEQAPFLDEALAGGTALATGQSYDQVRDFQRGMAQTDRENNGTARNVGGVAGALAGFAAPGSRYIGAAGNGVGQSLRAAGVGSAYGAAYGGGAADDSYASRLQGAVGGAVGGAVAGGAIQGGLNYAQRLASITSINRPPPISGTPEQMAASRIVRTMEPGALSERTRLNDLGLSPSVMDVTGGTTERLVRTAAGPAGTASNLAVDNLASRQASLKPDVIRDVRSLSPVEQSADDFASSLTARRSTLADEMYPEAYASRVPVTAEVLSALSDEPGRAALRRARAAAVARQNSEQVAEIDSLLNASVTRAPEPINLENRSLPSSSSLATPPVPTVEQMQRFGRVERVPLSAARRSQSWMDWDRVARGERPGDMVPGYGDRPVAVRREDGEFILMDGHHRTVRAIEDGAADAEMYVIDARDYAPDVAGVRPRASSREEDDALLRELGVEPSRGLEVSAGTLDRVRIAMQGRGAAMQQRPDTRDIAGGLFNRANQIDTALEGVPALAPARAAYRGMSQQIDALSPSNALDIFEDPRDFANRVQALTPEARDAALVRVTQDLTDRLGGQRNAGTGTIDTANQAPYARENLTALLGPERAQRFLSTLEARVQQTQRASRVAPTGSQTQMRAMDEGTLGAAQALGAVTDAGRGLVGDTPAIARTLDRVLTSIRSRSMSPEVREQIVRFGIGSADDLERIVMLADEARAAGRPVPRAVRSFIESSRQTIGPQFATSLESALLPMRAAAEEEQGPQ